MSRTSVIVDAVRSPMGVKNGNLIGIRADDLAAQVVVALLERQPDLPREAIEDVVLGCAFPEHTQGMLMARGVALLADIPKEAGGKVKRIPFVTGYSTTEVIDRIRHHEPQ